MHINHKRPKDKEFGNPLVNDFFECTLNFTFLDWFNVSQCNIPGLIPLVAVIWVFDFVSCEGGGVIFVFIDTDDASHSYLGNVHMFCSFSHCFIWILWFKHWFFFVCVYKDQIIVSDEKNYFDLNWDNNGNFMWTVNYNIYL